MRPLSRQWVTFTTALVLFLLQPQAPARLTSLSRRHMAGREGVRRDPAAAPVRSGSGTSLKRNESARGHRPARRRGSRAEGRGPHPRWCRPPPEPSGAGARPAAGCWPAEPLQRDGARLGSARGGGPAGRAQDGGEAGRGRPAAGPRGGAGGQRGRGRAAGRHGGDGGGAPRVPVPLRAGGGQLPPQGNRAGPRPAGAGAPHGGGGARPRGSPAPEPLSVTARSCVNRWLCPGSPFGSLSPVLLARWLRGKP